MSTVTFDDGLIRLSIPPEKVLDDQQLTALFDSIAEYLYDLEIDFHGRYSLSIVVDYLDDRK